MKEDQRIHQWIDFMEGEAEPSLREDLQKVLGHSREDAQVLKDLQSLRRAVRRVDTAAEATFDPELFERIMGDVDQRGTNGRRRKWFYGVSAGLAAAALAGILVVENFEGPTTGGSTVAQGTGREILGENQVELDTSAWLEQAAKKNPGAVADLVNAHESDREFVVDALSYQLDGLSDDQVDQALLEIMGE